MLSASAIFGATFSPLTITLNRERGHCISIAILQTLERSPCTIESKSHVGFMGKLHIALLIFTFASGFGGSGYGEFADRMRGRAVVLSGGGLNP